MITINVDNKPRHKGFDAMANRAIKAGFTAVSAGWGKGADGSWSGQASCRNATTGQSLFTTGADPVEAIAKLGEMLACGECLRIGMDGPGHFAKPTCESGGHTHCTCDICF